MARKHLAVGKFSAKSSALLYQSGGLLFAFNVNNKSYYSAKHNYKCEQFIICNHWHQLPSMSVRQLT